MCEIFPGKHKATYINAATKELQRRCAHKTKGPDMIFGSLHWTFAPTAEDNFPTERKLDKRNGKSCRSNFEGGKGIGGNDSVPSFGYLQGHRGRDNTGTSSQKKGERKQR